MTLSYNLDELKHNNTMKKSYKNIFNYFTRYNFLFYASNAIILWNCFNGIKTIVNFIDISSYRELALTPNLPFCEKPFEITPYMAQGASAMAHLPYVPVLLLGIGYSKCDTIPSMDIRVNRKASKIKNLLWTQTILQLFTSVFGHMIPNPRVVLNQEISILIAFVFLFLFFDFTTTKKNMMILDGRLFTYMALLSILIYLLFGIIPIIFTLFVLSLFLSYINKNAFGLLTEYSKKMLLFIFIPTGLVLVIETTACNWLLNNISNSVPWHLLFDILFWQVLGSAIDVIIISPSPGRFLVQHNED